jgi:hypothetical protein
MYYALKLNTDGAVFLLVYGATGVYFSGARARTTVDGRCSDIEEERG